MNRWYERLSEIRGFPWTGHRSQAEVAETDRLAFQREPLTQEEATLLGLLLRKSLVANGGKVVTNKNPE